MVDAIIVAPTRELAIQIFDDALRLCGRNTGIRANVAYGQARYARGYFIPMITS